MSRAPRSIDGALAAAAQLSAGELAAALLPGGRSPVSGTGRALIDTLPGPGVDMVVATARTADKAILKASLVGGWLAAGAAASRAFDRGRADAILAALGIAAGSAAATRRDAATPSTLAAGAAQALAGPTTLEALRGAARPQAARTGVVTAIAAALCVAAARRSTQHARILAKRGSISLPAAAEAAGTVSADAEFDVNGISPLFTPPERFYVTDTQLPAPHIDPDSWSLTISGMVDRQMEFTLDDLLRMPLVELDATLVCVHNPVGGDRVSTARWLGVPLIELLEHAGVQADAEQLLARSIDGFTAGIPIGHLTSGAPALLAVAMNGQPLPVENGFPARLLVPGLWGADASTKWVTALEPTTWGAVRDYWDRRGWPRRPSRVKPGSRIDTPRNRQPVAAGQLVVAGVAWAPPDGVSGVEVSVDGHDWQAAELAAEVAPTMWRHWRASVNLLPGAHQVRVRTIGRAATQDGEPEPPYPVGTSGYHAVQVTVVDGQIGAAQRARTAARAALDDAFDRVSLAADAVPAWRDRGYPPHPRFPAPAPASVSRRAAPRHGASGS